jgi:hypothetical protein
VQECNCLVYRARAGPGPSPRGPGFWAKPAGQTPSLPPGQARKSPSPQCKARAHTFQARSGPTCLHTYIHICLSRVRNSIPPFMKLATLDQTKLRKIDSGRKSERKSLSHESGEIIRILVLRKNPLRTDPLDPFIQDPERPPDGRHVAENLSAQLRSGGSML